MVRITPQAKKYMKELLEQNQKTGYGIKIYLSGYGAFSDPLFGMSFQKDAEKEDIVDRTAGSFKMFYDEETKKELDECVIEYVNDPNFGSGLTIRNPNISGASFGDDPVIDEDAECLNEDGIFDGERTGSANSKNNRKEEPVKDNNQQKLGEAKSKLRGLFGSKKNN